MQTSFKADSQGGQKGATMLVYIPHWLIQVERGNNSFIKVERGGGNSIILYDNCGDRVQAANPGEYIVINSGNVL